MESYQVFRWCRGDFEGREHNGRVRCSSHAARKKTHQTDAANGHDDALMYEVSAACATCKYTPRCRRRYPFLSPSRQRRLSRPSSTVNKSPGRWRERLALSERLTHHLLGDDY